MHYLLLDIYYLVEVTVNYWRFVRRNWRLSGFQFGWFPIILYLSISSKRRINKLMIFWSWQFFNWWRRWGWRWTGWSRRLVIMCSNSPIISICSFPIMGIVWLLTVSWFIMSWCNRYFCLIVCVFIFLVKIIRLKSSFYIT